ncbi:MAG: hypothetical protein GY757_06350, partial [bacterium]|nr:hypothetical protein [bacterium]
MPAAVQIALISKQELDKLNKDHVDLKVGDKLKGEVKDVRKDGKATIDFGRFQTDVELKGPVSKGDEVSVVVVEKGKQIKLKLEQIKSRGSAESPKTAKQADGIRSGEAGELKQKIDSLVQKEIEPPTNRQEFYKSNERLHRDIKNSLTKLQKILQSPTSADAKDLKNLASEIKSVLSSLESYDDALNISDKITKPLAKLDALLKESGIPLNKEVREVLSKIADAASRLGNLKNLDQLPEIKNIIDNELKPNLTRLKELIRNEAAASSPGNQKTAQEAQKAIEDIIKNLDKALQKLPDKVRPQSSTTAATKSTPQVVRETASPIPESGEVVKQISNLKVMVEKSGIPMDKETTDIIKNLSNAAEKIKNIKSPEQLPELKNIIEKEIKPNLERLKQVMAKEVAKPPTRADAKIRSALALKSEVDNAIKNLDKAMEKLPESVTRSNRRPDSGEVVKQITDLKTMVEKSGLPMDKETAEALQKLTDAAEKIKQMKSPEQAREVKDIIDKEIKPNLERVKQYIDQTRVKSETQSVSRQNAAAEKIKQAVQSSLHNVRRTSTQPAKSAELVKDIANLKAMVEKSDLPMNKETTAALQKLTDAADKIKQMKTPEQAQEVKNIIEKEIKPNLLRLRQSLDIGTPKTGTANVNAGRNSAENIKYAADKLLNQLAQSADKSQTTQNTEVRDAMKQISALKALAEKSGVPLSREAEALIGKLVETATKISQLQTAQQAEIQTGKMSREISAEIGKLIDKELKPNLNSLKQTMDREIAKAEPAKVSANRKSAAEIKQAVDKLLQNLEKTLEKLPAKMKTSESIETLLNEIKNIRRTLEASSETINTGDKIVKEVSNIKTLVEQAAVPFEKEMEVIITKLAETAQKISQLRDPSQIPEIRAIIDKELKPNLSELRKLINPGNTSTDSTPENNQSAETTKEISQRVEALQKEIAAALEKFPDKAQTSRDTRELLKHLSSVLNKISDSSNLPG